MNKEYLLILPNVFIEKPITIGNIALQRFCSEKATLLRPDAESDKITDNNVKELLLNVQLGLINNGFSGAFTYFHFTSSDEFEKIVLNIRKTMAVLRYVTFEKYHDLSLDSLTYYILESRRVGEQTQEPDMLYFLEGIQDGNRPIHFWAPGSRFVMKMINFPRILNLDNDHFLIQKFNSQEGLEEKYIIAIERFNRTFKEGCDTVEDVINLTTAFEHVLEEADSAELFSKSLINTLGVDYTGLEPNCKYFVDNLYKWGKEFYQIRSEVSHGNAFRHYSKSRGYEFWEDCFKWKHPDGTEAYINHITIAKKIFKKLIEKLIEGERITKSDIENATAEERKRLAELRYQLIASEIEPLIVPNEVYYRELKNLVERKEPFGESYRNFISKLRPMDMTGEKAVLFDLLNPFLDIIVSKLPNLQKECDEIKNLVKEKRDITLIGLKVFKLSDIIIKDASQREVFDEEVLDCSSLSFFLNSVYYSLIHIAWREKGKE